MGAHAYLLRQASMAIRTARAPSQPMKMGLKPHKVPSILRIVALQKQRKNTHEQTEKAARQCLEAGAIRKPEGAKARHQ